MATPTPLNRGVGESFLVIKSLLSWSTMQILANDGAGADITQGSENASVMVVPVSPQKKNTRTPLSVPKKKIVLANPKPQRVASAVVASTSPRIEAKEVAHDGSAVLVISNLPSLPSKVILSVDGSPSPVVIDGCGEYTVKTLSPGTHVIELSLTDAPIGGPHASTTIVVPHEQATLAQAPVFEESSDSSSRRTLHLLATAGILGIALISLRYMGLRLSVFLALVGLGFFGVMKDSDGAHILTSAKSAHDEPEDLHVSG
ncbi:hypothetical protein EBR66_04275 [bacterium]|nr:hypothetical protein [bacterium]